MPLNRCIYLLRKQLSRAADDQRYRGPDRDAAEARLSAPHRECPVPGRTQPATAHSRVRSSPPVADGARIRQPVVCLERMC